MPRFFFPAGDSPDATIPETAPGVKGILALGRVLGHPLSTAENPRLAPWERGVKRVFGYPADGSGAFIGLGAASPFGATGFAAQSTILNEAENWREGTVNVATGGNWNQASNLFNPASAYWVARARIQLPSDITLYRMTVQLNYQGGFNNADAAQPNEDLTMIAFATDSGVSTTKFRAYSKKPPSDLDDVAIGPDVAAGGIYELEIRKSSGLVTARVLDASGLEVGAKHTFSAASLPTRVDNAMRFGASVFAIAGGGSRKLRVGRFDVESI